MTRETLAPLMPHMLAELIAVAELLDEHRRFVADVVTGVAWPSLEDEIARPDLVLATLEEVRRGHVWPSLALAGASGR